MGSDNLPQNNDSNNITKNSYINGNNNINQKLVQNDYRVSNYNEKLNQIHRHRNIQKYQNFNFINTKPLHSSMPFKKQNSSEITSIFQRDLSLKLSQQYCSFFKRSYTTGENKYTFLNYLAGSLIREKQIPYEDSEKLKKACLPKYLFDWRNIQEQTNSKYWKNFGKIDVNIVEDALNKLGNNTIKKSEPFYLRRCWFYRYLMLNYVKNKNINPVIEINRKNILENSYDVLNRQKINLSRKLRIKFINEINNDIEGSYFDWYQSMFKEIISPKKKLFLINPYKSLEPFNIIIYPKYPGMRLELYEFIGKFIIKSIIDMITVRNFIINKFQLKLIKKIEITLDDIKYFRLDLYQLLKYINDNRIEGNKQLESIRFIWNINNGIINQEIELVPGGRNIFLNDQNKNIFISKIIYLEAIMPYEEQIKYIQKGLYSILGEDIQDIFTVEEMNFFITGQEYIDLRDLKENIIYKGEYNENHPVIQMFWEKLVTMNEYELIKFLEFSTGCSGIPIDGFGSLKDINGKIKKFTIEPFMNYSAENPDIYSFHEIKSIKEYNTIILPKYKTKKELNYAINIIINKTQ